MYQELCPGPEVTKLSSCPSRLSMKVKQHVLKCQDCMAFLGFKIINPLVTNGLSHLYHLDESTSIFRGIRSNFSFLFNFSIKIMSANRKAPDGTPILPRHILGYSVRLCPIKSMPGLYGLKPCNYYTRCKTEF